ncbi:MAG: Shedu anti-phage system protein SduA domain-containing protein [Victivallales bacterium]|jgi:hypothetical protein
MSEAEAIASSAIQLAEAISNLSDSEIPTALPPAVVNALLKAILPPLYTREQSVYEYLLMNRKRMWLAAVIRHLITLNCSVKCKIEGGECFLSPSHVQWFQDGIVFLQGKERFTGLIERYLDGKIEVAAAARTMRGRESMGVDDFMFIDIKEAKKQIEAEHVPNSVEGLELVFIELQTMLASSVEDEAKYQEFFTRNGWFFGLQFTRIDSHKAFNDENIPDFTGIRQPRGNRDIIEIKPPCLPLFTKNGNFRKEFHEAWNQCERYLTFADKETDYLRREKHLVFENPHCYLIAGQHFDDPQAKKIRDKEHMNPRITMMTYDEIMRLGRHTIDILKDLLAKTTSKPSQEG